MRPRLHVDGHRTTPDQVAFRDRLRMVPIPLPTRRIRDDGLTRRREPVNGVMTAWVERPGRPHTRPLVLIPGLSMSWHAFRWFLDRHPLDRPILVIDPPGCGRSARLPHRMDADAQAQHVAAWLDHLERGPVDVVGHSLGAITAARLAAQRADLVTSIILVSPSPDDRWPRMRNHVGALVKGVPAEAPRVFAQAAFDYLRSNPRVLAGFNTEAGRPASDVMNDVHTRVLVVRGSADRVSSRRWCDELAAAANGNVVTVPDGAHGLPQQMPGDLVAIVAAFTACRGHP